jgi:hypothetical protein
MMDKIGFEKFLKRGGRSQSAIQRCFRMIEEFEEFLINQRNGVSLDKANPTDLEDFVRWVERHPKTSAKINLWAIRYYFEFIANEEMQDLATSLRQKRMKRKLFTLKEFRGVDQRHAETLSSIGIVNIAQMLEAGRTAARRRSISEKTGVPLDVIVELLKLSDLARLSGVKRIRARLYYDAGVDTIEKLAQWDPEELRGMLIKFAERTGFEGVAPLPKEAINAVKTARKLPKIVEYD